jgi:hypothetical protein
MKTKYKDFTYEEISEKILDIINDFIIDNNLSGNFTNH